MTRVCLLGLGEVGAVFAEELALAGVTDLVAWDIAFDDPSSPASRNAAQLAVRSAVAAPAAVAGADVVVSAVTAANAATAAVSVADGFPAHAWFFDLNSSSPGQKRQAAAAIEAADGRYVEAALMSPINPRRLGAPFLLGGPHAASFVPVGNRLGFTDLTVYSDVVGTAAATKLCRSIVVKGLESLLVESLLAARAYGVERDVLDSLSNILPPADWEQIATYFMTRSLRHGERRAEEMHEAAATVADVGVEPIMTTATAARQAWAATHSAALDADEIMAMIDVIRERIEGA